MFVSFDGIWWFVHHAITISYGPKSPQTPKYLERIWEQSIPARAVHGDALRYCGGHGLRERYGLWTWVDPARGVSAGVELVWSEVGVDGWTVSLKSGFQLNPWLSSKRTRKMTEVHDMVRSPHTAKPFHFGPFVSLQLLIFMIAPPDITPTSGPDLTAAPTAGTKWTGLKNKVGRLERQRLTARFHCISEKYPHGKREMMRTKRKRKTQRTRAEHRKLPLKMEHCWG